MVEALEHLLHLGQYVPVHQEGMVACKLADSGHKPLRALFRVHARQKTRDHSISMGNEHRHALLQVLCLLEQCGSQAEFDAFIGVASSLIRNGFGHMRAAENPFKSICAKEQFISYHLASSNMCRWRRRMSALKRATK